MSHDDFTVEPIKGLPETPPNGEDILWQGRPEALALARQAMWLDWVLGYFALVALWRAGVSSASMPWQAALGTAVPFVVLGLLAGAIILGVAWVLARTTVYTITSERVAMRVGAALTITLNLPFPKIEKADLDLRSSGIGTIALTTKGQVRLSYLILWPHVRPWRMKKTDPALRCIADAERVAGILAEAAETRVSRPTVAVAAPVGAVAAE